MKEFSLLMFIFGLLVFLSGLFMFTGHRIGILTGRAVYKNLNKSDWIKIGKYTMYSSIGIFLLSIILSVL